ncbi:hypothetical protein EC973_008119 [Apophysomyces ossiformis]|uniref:SWIM-type domain-containing protein n=1 Tax=Apophysomyces ossiformis TaxID=679940 RepID=A0A8H7BTT6_9FUNG|nr:hypothetical protein EC973_008119 [Apophysomyces ossiformis]
MPAMAALYYHEHLEKTHALYCPDDMTESLPHIRQLARAMLNVVDSQSNKKVAVHFMKPLLSKTREDLLRYLYKCRPRLAIDCCVIPSTEFQHHLLSGWSLSLQDILWHRRCNVPFDRTVFAAFAPDNGRQIECLDYVEPFCVANDKFIKKALIVHINEKMCQFTADQGLAFSEIVQSVTDGWIEATEQLSEPSTMIFIANEKSLYGQISNFAQSSVDKQQEILDEKRKKLWTSLQAFARKCPLYLYLQDYRLHRDEAVRYVLARLQHRHHLCLSGSIYVSWFEDARSFDACPPYVADMQFFRLDSIPTSKQAKNWRNDIVIVSIWQIANYMVLTKSTPRKLNVSFKDHCMAPLLDDMSVLTREEQVDNVAVHSVSVASDTVAKAWKTKMQAKLGREIEQAGVTSSTSGPIPGAESTEESMERRERLANQISESLIKSYIDNSGAFQRGQALLDTLSELKIHDNVRRFTIEAEAKGTAAKPYSVRIDMTMDQLSAGKYNGDVIENGFCSCPVGSGGRCKHCTALLLQFKSDPLKFGLKSAQAPAAGKKAELAVESRQLHLKPLSAPVASVTEQFVQELSKAQTPEEDIQDRPKTGITPVRTGRRKLPWATEEAVEKPAKKQTSKRTKSTKTVTSSETHEKSKPTKRQKKTVVGSETVSSSKEDKDDKSDDEAKSMYQAQGVSEDPNQPEDSEAQAVILDTLDEPKQRSSQIQTSSVDTFRSDPMISDSDNETDDGFGWQTRTISRNDPMSWNEDRENAQEEEPMSLTLEATTRSSSSTQDREKSPGAEKYKQMTTDDLFDELGL